MYVERARSLYCSLHLIASMRNIADIITYQIYSRQNRQSCKELFRL
jgi:hypothetical protein